jgi:hypothetical protein
MTNYVATLVNLVPDALISYAGTEVSFESIEWQDSRPMPTKAECEAAWPQIEYQLTYASVERTRRERYQKETDGMFFAAQRTDGDLTAWNAAVDSIKAELPYPTAPKK